MARHKSAAAFSLTCTDSHGRELWSFSGSLLHVLDVFSEANEYTAEPIDTYSRINRELKASGGAYARYFAGADGLPVLVEVLAEAVQARRDNHSAELPTGRGALAAAAEAEAEHRFGHVATLHPDRLSTFGTSPAVLHEREAAGLGFDGRPVAAGCKSCGCACGGSEAGKMEAGACVFCGCTCGRPEPTEYAELGKPVVLAADCVEMTCEGCKGNFLANSLLAPRFCVDCISAAPAKPAVPARKKPGNRCGTNSHSELSCDRLSAWQRKQYRCTCPVEAYWRVRFAVQDAGGKWHQYDETRVAYSAEDVSRYWMRQNSKAVEAGRFKLGKVTKARPK